METKSTSDIRLISKEEVSGLLFPPAEITRTKEEKQHLFEKLHQATVLGNIDHSKIRIIFDDDQGRKMIETTIWATGEKHIVLKHGITIPIHRIVDINFH